MIGPLTARQLLILAVTGIVLYGVVHDHPRVRPAGGVPHRRHPDRGDRRVPRARPARRHHPGPAGAGRAAPADEPATPGGRAGRHPPGPGVADQPGHPHQHGPREGQGSRGCRGVRGSAVSPAALRLPAEAVTDTGVIDLGKDGVAVVAVCSTINFGLRTPAEQESPRRVVRTVPALAHRTGAGAGARGTARPVRADRRAPRAGRRAAAPGAGSRRRASTPTTSTSSAAPPICCAARSC